MSLAAPAFVGAPVGAQARTLSVGDARLNYVVAGSGPAVVLIHGWALSLREWHDQIVALAPSHRVIAYDRRGYGGSTGHADPSADPGDIRALLDTLGIRAAVLVGHSAGADVAQRFAAALPDRVVGLVLYGGPPPDGFPGVPPRGADPRRAIAKQFGRDSVLRMALALPQFRPGPNRSRSRAARLDSILSEYSGSDLTHDHPPSQAFPPAILDDVRTWRFPVLFVSGEHEAPRWHQVSDSLVRWMPNARKVVIPGGGHGVHFDEPDLFNTALLAFLRDAMPARR
ncbi:MAG TPA: alpha/beta hydrolase [Gemmatimonadaceae bacterium]|nr:alpha/beta hydrolase [Gemmatimonadaceae bacterium]